MTLPNEVLDDIEAAGRAMSVHCCPFCESDEVVIYESHKGGFYVACDNCGMRGPRKDEEADAIRAYNSLRCEG